MRAGLKLEVGGARALHRDRRTDLVVRRHRLAEQFRGLILAPSDDDRQPARTGQGGEERQERGDERLAHLARAEHPVELVGAGQELGLAQVGGEARVPHQQRRVGAVAVGGRARAQRLVYCFRESVDTGRELHLVPVLAGYTLEGGNHGRGA